MAGSSMFDVSFKAFNGQFNIDEAEGIVECFVAAIGNKDSVGDVVLSGAFNESLKRRKPRVVWGHSWNDPIGKVLEIYEVPPNDPRLPAKMKQAGVGGLYAKVQFNLATEKGREAFASVAFFGHEQEWSIGYKTLQATFDPNIQANMLKEVELYEVSPVLHGANQLTATLSVKSDENEKMHGMGMPGFGPQQAPKLVVVRLEEAEEEEDDEDEKSRDLFAEGEARSISPEMRNALEMELMSRSDEPIKVINATENSAVFVRKIGDAKLTYRISYHYDEDVREFMFGKPERISGAAEARATGTTVIPSQMPGMPMTIKPGVSMPMQPTQMLMQKYGIDESSITDERLKQAINLLSEVVAEHGKSVQPEVFSVYVKTEQIYEAKQLIDPVLQYHRLEYEIDDEGIHVISPLSEESREALRTARKSLYSHFGRGSLGKAVGASDSSGAPEDQEVKALGGKLGARIGGGLRSAGPGMSFVDITGTVDADTDGIVFEGKPGLERPIIPRFTVPKELARKLSKLTVGDAESIERQRRAGNTNIQFDENRLRSLIRDLGEDPSALSRMEDDGSVPAQPAGARSITRPGQMGQGRPSLSGMSNDELQREWDANKPYRPRPGVIGMNPMLEDDKAARRREILKEMRKRGMEPEGGVPADIAATEFIERARDGFDRLKPPSKPPVRRTPPDPNRRLGQSGSRSGLSGMSNDELQREWDANKPYQPRPGVIGMNPMLEDDKVARRREIAREMRKRKIQPEGGFPPEYSFDLDSFGLRSRSKPDREIRKARRAVDRAERVYNRENDFVRDNIADGFTHSTYDAGGPTREFTRKDNYGNDVPFKEYEGTVKSGPFKGWDYLVREEWTTGGPQKVYGVRGSLISPNGMKYQIGSSGDWSGDNKEWAPFELYGIIEKPFGLRSRTSSGNNAVERSDDRAQGMRSRSGLGGRIDQTPSSASERRDFERRYRDVQLLSEIQDRIDALEQEKRAWEMGGGKFERNGVTYTVNRRDQNRADKAQEKIDKLKQRLDLVKSQQESRDQNARDRAQEAVRPLSDSERERMEDLRSKVIDPRTGKPYSKAVRQMRYQQYLKDYWKRRMEAEKTDFNLRYSDFNGGDFEQYDEMFKENLRKLRALERRDRGGPISPRSAKPANDPWKNWDPKPLMGGSRSRSISKIDNIFDLAERLDEMQETYRNLSSGKGREDTWKEMSTIDKRYTSAIDDLHKAVGVGGLYEESRRLRDAANATDDRFEKQALLQRAKFIDDNLVPWFRKLDDKARRQPAGARSYSGPTVNGTSLPVWDELSSMRRINGPTGLNKGYWFRDDSTGRTFFAKLGRSDEHAQSEAASSAIYRVAGSGVPSKAVIKGEGGKMWVVSEKLADLTETARPSREIQDLAKLDMGVDMLLQNRDGWSGGSNKLVGPDGTMYTIDTGGAGIFRAQGGDKYPPFSPDAPWDDVATMVYRPGASSQHMSGLYGRVSNEDFVRAMQQVASIDLVEADSAMKEVGTPDEMRKQFIDTIAARQKIARDYIDEFSQYDPAARVDISGSRIRPGGTGTTAGAPVGSRSRVSDRRAVDEFLSTEQPTGSVVAERRRINFEEPDDERDGLREWLGSSGAVLQIEEDGDGGYVARLLRETDNDNLDTVIEDIFPTEGEARRFLNREYSSMARGAGARSATRANIPEDEESVVQSRFWPGHVASRSFDWTKPDRMVSQDGFEKMEWDASQGAILMITGSDLPGRGGANNRAKEYSAWMLPLENGEPGTPSAVYGEMVELPIPSDIDTSDPREVAKVLQNQENMLKREAQQMAVLKRRMDEYDASVGSRSRASDRRAVEEFLNTEQPVGAITAERRRINFDEPDDEVDGLREWYGSSGAILQIEDQDDGSVVGRLVREADGGDQLETISEDIFASDSEAKRFLNREYSSFTRQSGSRSRTSSVTAPEDADREFESELNAIENVAFMSMLDALGSEDVFGDDALTPGEIANYLEFNIVPQGKERTVSAAWSQHDSIINDPVKQRRMGLRSTSQSVTSGQLADRQMVQRDGAGRIVPQSTLDEALATRYGRIADRLREVGMSEDEIGQLIGDGLRSRSRLSEVSRSGYPRSFDEYADTPPSAGLRSKSGLPVPQYPRTVGMGPFVGSAEDEFDGIDNWADFADALRGKEIVFLDYETTGIVFDQHGQVLSKGVPTQIGAVKVKDGKVVGRFNLYVNPGSPKSEWAEWSQKNLKDSEGNLITDEFMADKPSVADAHQQLIDFIGETQLLGMQNAPFDNDVLTAALEASGMEWRPSGIIDTKELADVVIPKYSADNQDAPFLVGKGDVKYASTSLGALAPYFKVDLGDKHHTADADAEATALVMQRMVEAAAEKGWSTDALDRGARQARLEEAQRKFDASLKGFEERKAKFIEAEEKAEEIELDRINMLSEAAAKSEVLSIEYTKPKEEEPTVRSVIPIEVFDEKGNLYLRALDRDKGEERSFRLDRIGRVESTGETDRREFGERQEWSFSGQGAGSRSRSSSNNKKKGPSKKLTPEQVRISQEQKLRAKKIPGKRKDGPTKQEWGFRSRSAGGAIGALADIDSLPNSQRDEDQKHLLRVMRQAKLKFEYSQDARGGMIVDLRLTDEPQATADDAREAFANAMGSDERAREVLSSMGFDLEQRPWRDVQGRQGSRSRSARFMSGDGFNSDIRSVAAYTAARRAGSNGQGSGMRSRSTSGGRTEVAAEATFFKQILDSLPREISEARKANDRATAEALSELSQIMRRQKSAEVGPKRTNAGSLYLTQDEADQVIDALMFVLDRQTSNEGSRAPAFAKLIDMIAASAMSTFINKATPEITDRFVMRENSQGRMVKVPIAR